MSKKLFAEVEKVLKDVRTFMESYDEKWQELRDFNRAQLGVKEKYWEEGRKEQMRGKKHAVRTATLELMDFKHVCDSKAKIETEMEGILRKLHRFRQQIIEWLGNIDLRGYRDELFDIRKQIELRYKRGKSFYKLGLSSDDCDDGERQRAEDTQSWINEFIQKLSTQADEFDADMDMSRGELAKILSKESARHSKKHQDKRPVKPSSHLKDKIDQLQAFAELHRSHIRKLEGILRHIRRHEILLTDSNIEELRETLLPYVENNSDLTVVVAEDVYTDLGLNFDHEFEFENSPSRLSSAPGKIDNDQSPTAPQPSPSVSSPSPESCPKIVATKVSVLTSSICAVRNEEEVILPVGENPREVKVQVVKQSPSPKRRFNASHASSPPKPTITLTTRQVSRVSQKSQRLEHSAMKPSVSRWAGNTEEAAEDSSPPVPFHPSPECPAGMNVNLSEGPQRSAWYTDHMTIRDAKPREAFGEPETVLEPPAAVTTLPHAFITVDTAVTRWSPSAEGGTRHQMHIEPNEELHIVKRDSSGWTYGFVILHDGSFKEGWFPNSICQGSKRSPRRSSVSNSAQLESLDDLSGRRKSLPTAAVSAALNSKTMPNETGESIDSKFNKHMTEFSTPQSVMSRCSTSPSPSLKHEPICHKSNESLDLLTNPRAMDNPPTRVFPTSVSETDDRPRLASNTSNPPTGYAVIHVIPDQVQVHELQWTWNGELASEAGTKLLRFQKGERVEVLLHNEAGWIFGRIRCEPQRQGWFPDYMLRSPDELLRSLLQELRQVGDEVIRPLAGVGSVAAHNAHWNAFASKNEPYKKWSDPWNLSHCVPRATPFCGLDSLGMLPDPVAGSKDQQPSLFSIDKM